MNRLTFVPVGGLANRMRAMASAVALGARAGVAVSVVWFRDAALGARFADLFQPQSVVPLREATALDALALDRPRRHNLWLPAVWQRLRYGARIYERSVTPLTAAGFDYAAWAQSARRLYMASYSDFFAHDAALLGRLFVPVEQVRTEVERRTAGFAPETVGVHIRRTDHAESIAKSPTTLFTDRLDADLEQNPELGIYLATDSEEVKAQLVARYGRRVVTSARSAGRLSADAMRDGLADMLCLARTARIYGTAGTTFSEMAARLGGISLVRLQQ